MGILMLNNRNYSGGSSGGGGGNADIIELTQAEYDALPDTKLTDNKMYLIKDGTSPSPSGGSSALVYDTTEKEVGTFFNDALFQKSFRFADGDCQLVRNAWTAISDVTINNLKDVVDIEMMGYDTAANKYPAVVEGCSKRFVSNTLNYYLNIDFPIFLRSVTVRYTKTWGASLDLIYSNRSKNSNTDVTYTVQNKARLLVANININGEASTQTLSSDITTTGTKLYSYSHSSGWSSPQRNHSMHWSVIDVDPNDTITFTVASTGNFTTQAQCIWKLYDNMPLDQMTEKVFDLRYDGELPAINTYSPLTQGIYLNFGIKSNGNNQNYSPSDISLTSDNSYIETRGFDISGQIIVSVMLTKNPATITSNVTSGSDYCSRGYGVIQLS